MQTLITSTRTARIILKPAVFGLSLWPAAAFARDVWFGGPGPAPSRHAIGATGGTLLRRILGVCAFFYASVHALVNVTFEPLAAVQLEGVGSAWEVVGDVIALIGHEIAYKPFIALGVIAVATLLPLAVTSSAAMIRRL